MTTYVSIPTADIDTDSPLTQSLMTALRDNPTAITEGASGAPRNKRPSFDNGVLHRWFYDYGDSSNSAVTISSNTSYDPGLYQFTTLTIDATYTLDLTEAGVLVLVASTSITINGSIDVSGFGGDGAVQVGDAGIFGGSAGGGSSYAGGYTYATDGGSSGAAGAAQSSEIVALLLATAQFVANGSNLGTRYENCGGGGGGGNSSAAGGNGGGLVILCAPIITVGAAGVINADGNNGGGTGRGGGGGGTIVIATPAGGYTDNSTGGVHADGGAAGGGTSGAGGAGNVEILTL